MKSAWIYFFLFCAAVRLVGATPVDVRTGEDWLPLTSGGWGEINARDGDKAFNAAYFSAADFSGQPVFARLETTVGAEMPADAVPAGRGRAARWSATLTPRITGMFKFSLQATGTAVLRLDEKILILRSAATERFEERSVDSIRMEAGKPYDIVIGFQNPTGQGRIHAEWSVTPEAAIDVKPISPPVGETLADAGPGVSIGPPARLENATYVIESKEDGRLVITEKSSGAAAAFEPAFTVVFQPVGQETAMDTKGGKYADSGPTGDTNYVVPSWGKETDFLVAAQPRTRLRATAAELAAGKIVWKFPEQPGYALRAEIALPAAGGEPALTFQLRAKATGQFSVGYVGAPSLAVDAASWIWQPLIWQDKRFPNRSYLTKEYQCPIPFVMIGDGGTAIGVGADSREMPYRMPTNEDSRFGVLVRNAYGQAQPMLFAPVLGGLESKMNAGAGYEFMLRLFVRNGSWFDGYKHLAKTLYNFGDVRENGLVSLNTTIENLTDFVLNDRFCYWYPQYKTWGYQNDGGPGAGRQQSAADAVSLALVLDREEFLKRRAVPTLEYMLSRNTLTTKFTEPKFMGGSPINAPSDLVATYRLTGGRSTVIRNSVRVAKNDAKPLPPGRDPLREDKNLLNLNLALYRLNGNEAHLAAAVAAADRYIKNRIEKPAVSFEELGSSFWTEMAPPYDLLYELYEETRDPRHLQAATAAMRQFTAYTYLVPAIPSGSFTANLGGIYNNQPVPMENVPAWRVSANGLTAECAGTAHSHRGIFMAGYASYLTRLARDAGEPFFSDIARNAVVGRYANYPSYAYRNGYSTVYEKPDFPLRPFEEIKKFTSAHYNHPLPMTAFLVDYLVSDIYARSDARITFPSDFTLTGAYFRNKVYGARPGRFYDEEGVYLWLPKHLVQTDSIQINYLAGHGNGKLYLAFSNQSERPVMTAFTIAQSRVQLVGTRRARVWTNNQVQPDMFITDNRGRVTIPAKGLVAIAIDGATIRTEIQDAMLDPASPPLPTGSSRSVETPVGNLTATALRFGRELTSVHVWLDAAPPAVKSATLRYELAGKETELACAEYPFEFTVPVSDAEEELRCIVVVDTPTGKIRLPAVTVRLKPSDGEK